MTSTVLADAPEPSPQSERLVGIYRRWLRPLTESWVPRGLQLRLARWFVDSGGLVRLPRGSRAWTAKYGPVRGGWVRAAEADAANGIVLHLHGGGFTFGSPRSHRGMAHGLSHGTGMPVFLPRYRLAPRHPFPAAADDCFAAYRELLDRGVAARDIRVTGDSAGGHLACCLLADIARAGLPMPAAVVLYSPMLDLSCAEARERDAAIHDPFISPVAALAAARAYAGDTDPADARMDVLACDKTGWPPTLVQSGELECLRGDSEALAKALCAAGVPCELQVWPGQMHVFQAFTDYLPEARDAVALACEFLRTGGR